MAVAHPEKKLPPAGRPDVDPEFPTRARALRTRQGWSQTELAKLIGVSAKTIGNYEAGRSAPQMGPELRRYAHAFHLTPGELLYGD